MTVRLEWAGLAPTRALAPRRTPAAAALFASPPAPAAVAAGAYLLAAFFMFGLPLVESSNQVLGFGGDPQIFIWALAWWPHALVNGLDPLVSHAIYYPQGLDLAHGALVPAAAILLWPLTATIGPLGAYDVGMALCPALAAWFAFLLCRRLTRAFWPSLVGGWLFGFSPYLLGQMAGHLHLTLVFLVPAAVHLALRVFDRELRRGPAVALLALTLTLQLLIAGEVFVSMTMFGAVALLAAWIMGSAADRERLRALVVTLLIAYVVTLVVCSLYLNKALAPGGVPVLPARGDIVSADFLSYLVPSTLTHFGAGTFASTTAQFTEGAVEGGAYLTLPLIAMAILGLRAGWRPRESRHWLGVRVALATAVVVIVCSFGGHLHIDGHFTLPMPWAFVNDLPVVGLLLPARFTLYVFLLAAVLTAFWLAGTRFLILGACLSALAVALAFPALPGVWDTSAPLPPLFATSAYKRYISSRDVALVLPLGGLGPAMLWQAQTDFAFKLAGGYALPPEAPNPYKNDPLYGPLQGTVTPSAAPLAASFLARHRVTVVLMAPGQPTTPSWEALLEHLGWRPAVHGGVLIMRHA